MIDLNTKEQKTRRKNIRFVLYGELIFVTLPFIILTLVQFQKEEFWQVFQRSDWAIAATILAGQTSVRLFSGLTRSHGIVHWQKTGFWHVLMYSFTLICLTDFIILELSPNPLWIFIYIQIPLFCISGYTFLILGSVGQYLLELPKSQMRRTVNRNT